MMSRRIAVICSFAVLARICGMNVRPDNVCDAVVYGISTTSSESLPLAVWPFGDSRPTTLKTALRIWISPPTGS